MKTRLLLAVAALVALAGCSSDNKPASTLTEHQRDSVLAKSSLPGAAVVGGALYESDRASNRAANMSASMDSLSR
jgi:uncharacterized protein YcfL